MKSSVKRAIVVLVMTISFSSLLGQGKFQSNEINKLYTDVPVLTTKESQKLWKRAHNHIVWGTILTAGGSAALFSSALLWATIDVYYIDDATLKNGAVAAATFALTPVFIAGVLILRKGFKLRDRALDLELGSISPVNSIDWVQHTPALKLTIPIGR